jgi:hypothetical protein
LPREFRLFGVISRYCTSPYSRVETNKDDLKIHHLVQRVENIADNLKIHHLIQRVKTADLKTIWGDLKIYHLVQRV